MNDLKESGIFNEDDSDIYDDFDFIEEQADWLFESDVSNAEKIEALRSIKIRQEEYEKTRKSQYLLDQEKRIQAKRKELIEKGIIEPDPQSTLKSHKITTRYGRSPLHEAVAMKDIQLIKKYVKSEKYLDEVDNNGHTAMEMAYYDNYKKALVIFDKYIRTKQVG